ncbi:hypothetical protein [Mycobacterium sp. 94-17]|uniref:8-oxoguanine DNA glycosylase OGG fold protein n=1 Tax=Mycobacterium sp. 94-17 TaxID=2986147 RepID=UPI002D1F60AF|nr:hypothetical protein [Mycobacterium sp. 94-17]MEB4211298.1 hypothetical protein [Mycobacterium sp. 94-17]
MTATELAAVLFGDDGPPDREELLDQGFTRDPSIIKNALPDSRLWPQEFDALPISHGRIRIDRRLVFTTAERAVLNPNDDWAAAQLHAAAAVWGAKPGAITYRAFRPLSNSEAPERLKKALALVRGEGALSAYKAMLGPKGRLNLPYLASSFFTKFLYFAGWDAKSHRLMPQPLIMDDDVIEALNTLTEEPWQRESVADYERYIELARQVAYEANTSADVVEWRLWGWGRGQLR